MQRLIESWNVIQENGRRWEIRPGTDNSEFI